MAGERTSHPPFAYLRLVEQTISFQNAKVSFLAIGGSLGKIRLERLSPTADLDPAAVFHDNLRPASCQRVTDIWTSMWTDRRKRGLAYYSIGCLLVYCSVFLLKYFYKFGLAESSFFYDLNNCQNIVALVLQSFVFYSVI